MDTYLIQLPGKKEIAFSMGKAYLVQSKIEMDQKELFDSDDALYVNYSFSEALRVIPFFEKLKVAERKRIAEHLQDFYGVKIRVDDMFGKLVISLFYNLELYNLVIVGLVGLSASSIEMLKGLIAIAVSKEKSKVIILVETVSGLDRMISVTAL